MVIFCPNCGSLMLPKKYDKKKRMICPNCGYVEDEVSNLKISEKNKAKSEIDVIEDPENTANLPKVEVTCPKCDNNEAYFWTVQTRASDEPETKFYKCTKCSYTWRDYS